MNRSRYVTRQIDGTDRAIIAALSEDGRMTIKAIGKKIGMSSPSVRDRILKLHDAGAIIGYTVVIDPIVFGLGISAFVRMNVMPGQIDKLEAVLNSSDEIVQAYRMTGESSILAKVVVRDAAELQAVVDRFQNYASADTAIILSSTVALRNSKL